MRKPNYGFEKRQKELAKAQKREEKRLKKAARAEGEGVAEDGVSEGAPMDAAPPGEGAE